MAVKDLTDAELLVLGLVAEMPRHGYQLDQVMEQRVMREWTHIGFSSIYFVLGKLEKMGLVTAKRPAEAKSKAKRIYAVTKAGRRALVTQALAALSTIRPTYSSVLLGMVNWQVLERNAARRGILKPRNADVLHALANRRQDARQKIHEIAGVYACADAGHAVFFTDRIQAPGDLRVGLPWK